MNLATTRASSAYHDLADALDHWHALSAPLQDDAIDLACDYGLGHWFLPACTRDDQVAFLDRLASLIAAHGCPAEWSVCPCHGNTLASSGGATRCQAVGCGRTWGWDRLRAPCGRRTTRSLITPLDPEVHRLCALHAADARDQVDGAMLL